MRRSRDPEGRLRQTKAPTTRIYSATINDEQSGGVGQRQTATDQLTVSGGWRFRTRGHSHERTQMTRSRDLEGRPRQTKAPTARICNATNSTEQLDGAGQRETATDQLTVPGGVELLEAPSRARSSSSATGDQEGVGRGGRASASDQETPKALRRAIGRTPLDPARTRSRHLVVFSVCRRAQIEVWSLSHHRPHHPVQSRISRPLDADATR
jgi:hypothetical protein